MRILFFTDIHHDIGNIKHYPATAYVLPAFWKLLNDSRSSTDLVILGGDLTVAGPARISELQDFKDKLDSCGMPYIAVPGNHDLAPNKTYAKRYPGMEDYEDMPLESTNFYKVFGEKGVRFSISAGRVCLIGFAIRDDDPDGQVGWLINELKKPGLKLVFCHYPIFPARENGFCHSWEYNRIGKVINKLRELIQDPVYNVLIYFCGHLHINSKIPVGNAFQVVNGASGLSAVSYKTIEISDKSIDVNTFRIPGFTGFAGNIMCPDDSIDSTHKNIEEYHWGRDDERDFCIHYKT